MKFISNKMDLFLEEHKKFLALLLKHEVKFILIGGYAVIYHGYERTTNDMDIWLKPTNNNRDRFINALKEQGIISQQLNAVGNMDFTKPQALYIGEKPNKIDFLTKVPGLDYTDAEGKKVILELERRQIPVLNYEHVIVTKLVSGRSQDKADVDMLQKIRKAKGKE